MPVKEEDLDWIVYHVLSDKGAKTAESLARDTGLPGEAVNASLLRLRTNLLIDCRDGYYDILSIPEMLFRCQCRYGENLPLVIEDGVIKMKKPEQ